MSDKQEEYPKIKSESANIWPMLIFIGVAFLTYTVGAWAIDFKKHNIWDKVEYRNQAFEKCVDACTNVSFAIMDVSKNAGKISQIDYENDKQILNKACNDKCQYI